LTLSSVAARCLFSSLPDAKNHQFYLSIKQEKNVRIENEKNETSKKMTLNVQPNHQSNNQSLCFYWPSGKYLRTLHIGRGRKNMFYRSEEKKKTSTKT
jgi:hypothetical protein